MSFSASEDELLKLAYMGRTFTNVLRFKVSFKFFDLDSIPPLKVGHDPKKSFRVRCAGDRAFPADELERMIGSAIYKDCGGAKVDLSSPDVSYIAVFSAGTCFLGSDVAGFDISKRDYMVFHRRRTLKPTVAAAAVMKAGWERGILLDPFCNSGTITIEAALMAKNKSPQYYRKRLFQTSPVDPPAVKDDRTVVAVDEEFSAIAASRKNAKVAGVDIQFSRNEVEWLDTKFGNGEVSAIVTYPPNMTSRSDSTRRYRDLFACAKTILDGRMVILTRSGNEVRGAAEGWALESSETVWQGAEDLEMLVFKKLK